jgi:hypothetical protein
MFLLLFNSPDLLRNRAGKDPDLKHGVSEGNTLGTRLGPLVGPDPGNEVAIIFVFVKWKHHMNSFWRHILIHVLLANCVCEYSQFYDQNFSKNRSIIKIQ